MKDSYYFPHDSNAQHDPKILEMRAILGWEGYGIYWAILERLRNESEYQIKENVLPLALNLSQESLEKIIKTLESCGLIARKNGYIYCESFLRRMKEIDKKIKKCRQSGSVGGKRKHENMKLVLANATNSLKRNPSDPLAVKESKVKESKVKESKERIAEKIGAESKPLTGIQEIVLSYKLAKGIDKDDAGWDTANFSRSVRAAKSILEAFRGDINKAKEFVSLQGSQWNQNGRIDWTLSGIETQAWNKKNMDLKQMKKEGGGYLTPKSQEKTPISDSRPIPDEIRILFRATRLAKNLDKEIEGWDEINFEKEGPAAQKLLKFCCGDIRMAGDFIVDKGLGFTQMGMNWTLGTILRHAYSDEKLLIKIKEKTNVKREQKQVGIDAVPERDDHQEPSRGGEPEIQNNENRNRLDALVRGAVRKLPIPDRP